MGVDQILAVQPDTLGGTGVPRTLAHWLRDGDIAAALSRRENTIPRRQRAA